MNVTKKVFTLKQLNLKKYFGFLLLSLLTVLLVGCDNPFKPESDKVMEQFYNAVSGGNYSEAEELLGFSNQLKDESSFSDFAEENLRNMSYEMGEKDSDGNIPVT